MASVYCELVDFTLRSDIAHSVVSVGSSASTHSYIPFCAGNGCVFLGAQTVSAVSRDSDAERSISNLIFTE